MPKNDRPGTPGTLAEPLVRWEPAGKGVGFFVAYQPDLPGCMAQGDTADEAKASLAALIPGYLDLMRQDGLRELPPDPDWPPPPPRRRPREGLQARTIRLPAEVWQRLDDTARAHLRSANAEAECAVRAWVERQT
jgi:predicted RNase H-like HicB family nuclease